MKVSKEGYHFSKNRLREHMLEVLHSLSTTHWKLSLHLVFKMKNWIIILELLLWKSRVRSIRRNKSMKFLKKFQMGLTSFYKIILIVYKMKPKELRDFYFINLFKNHFNTKCDFYYLCPRMSNKKFLFYPFII